MADNTCARHVRLPPYIFAHEAVCARANFVYPRALTRRGRQATCVADGLVFIHDAHDIRGAHGATRLGHSC